ncbi:VCBS domain-containing protein [Oligella ureolytica]|uniref:VCBS domain-containing protein n=1 Tax=Oligella ureolytica TaxID=90244 RepID=A0A7T3EV19_9BURK|nr:VCBS domain-containing protein [Oligella ureolytica]QPT39538.1 VCBS domain-containing protein [Oligella ureolytica]
MIDYGHLVLNADGSYTYTLDNTNPAVQALMQTNLR